MTLPVVPRAAPPGPAPAARAPRVPRYTRPSLHGLTAALRYPGFRLLWLSLLPGTFGMMMAVVAFGYVAYHLSGSTTTLGLVNAGWGIPMFLFSPLAGVVADRFSRYRILVVTQAIIGLTAVAAAALIITGAIEVWHLIVLTMAQGTGFAFNMPARQALIAEMVDRADLANALALNNAGLNFNRVAGPAVAGALLASPAAGAGGVFAAMAALYALVLVLLWRLAIPAGAARTGAGRAARAGGVRPSRVAQLTEGLRYVAGRPRLRYLLLLAFLPLLAGMPYQALMPAIADQVLGVDAAGLGMLMAANGLGALVGSLVLAALSGAVPLDRFQYVAGLLFGVSLFAFAFAGAFVPALFVVAVVGGAAAAYAAVNNTLLMSDTPPEYHGRVMGVYMMTFAAMPLSSLPAAWLADHTGLVPVIAGCGLLSALVVGILGRVPVADPAPISV